MLNAKGRAGDDCVSQSKETRVFPLRCQKTLRFSVKKPQDGCYNTSRQGLDQARQVIGGKLGCVGTAT